MSDRRPFKARLDCEVEVVNSGRYDVPWRVNFPDGRYWYFSDDQLHDMGITAPEPLRPPVPEPEPEMCQKIAGFQGERCPFQAVMDVLVDGVAVPMCQSHADAQADGELFIPYGDGHAVERIIAAANSQSATSEPQTGSSVPPADAPAVGSRCNFGWAEEGRVGRVTHRCHLAVGHLGDHRCWQHPAETHPLIPARLSWPLMRDDGSIDPDHRLGVDKNGHATIEWAVPAETGSES